MLTALEGVGQQCNAAPAWTASTEPDVKGSLEISALTRARLLHISNVTLTSTKIFFLIQKEKLKDQHKASSCHSCFNFQN